MWFQPGQIARLGSCLKSLSLSIKDQSINLSPYVCVLSLLWWFWWWRRCMCVCLLCVHELFGISYRPISCPPSTDTKIRTQTSEFVYIKKRKQSLSFRPKIMSTALKTDAARAFGWHEVTEPEHAVSEEGNKMMATYESSHDSPQRSRQDWQLVNVTISNLRM